MRGLVALLFLLVPLILGCLGAAEPLDVLGPVAPPAGGPALPAELSELRFDERFTWLDRATAGSRPLGEYGGQKGSFYQEDQRLVSVSVSLPEEASSALVAAWGPPTPEEVTTVTGGGGFRRQGGFSERRSTSRRELWWNPATRTKATLFEPLRGHRLLTLSGYLPAAELLGENGPAIAFTRGEPVLGQTLDELAAVFGERLCALSGFSWTPWTELEGKGRPVLRLPPTEYGDTHTIVHLTLDPTGRVQRYSFTLARGNDRAYRLGVNALLERKFGPARRLEREDVYGEGPWVVVDRFWWSFAVQAEERPPEPTPPETPPRTAAG